MNDVIHVRAHCEAIEGQASDGAYDLLGKWTPEEFCAELLKTLKGGWGLTNAGECRLVISITTREE